MEYKVLGEMNTHPGLMDKNSIKPYDPSEDKVFF